MQHSEDFSKLIEFKDDSETVFIDVPQNKLHGHTRVIWDTALVHCKDKTLTGQ